MLRRQTLAAATLTLTLTCAGGSAQAAAGDGAAKLLGKLLAVHLAGVLPAPRASTVVDERGGPFCEILPALGWPPAPGVAASAAGTPLARPVLNLLQWGAKYCGWKQ